MPDSRRHRGRHPDDTELFADGMLDTLRRAVAELSWLLSRGYSETSSLALVGDRYQLRSRQRTAVLRAACSDESLANRSLSDASEAALDGAELALDGFNCLITMEAALSGGLTFRGRDGVVRDISSVHGSYRRVEETERAIDLLADLFRRAAPAAITWYLDRPVSNSGRLRALLEERSRAGGIEWSVELVNNPDRVLVGASAKTVVASSDGWVIDRADSWIDLPGLIITEGLPEAWLIDLRARD
jgi:hypothetical protein